MEWETTKRQQQNQQRLALAATTECVNDSLANKKDATTTNCNY